MKIIIKSIIVFIALCMLAGTLMIFIEDTKILFTKESAIYLSTISNANYVFSVIFFIGYVCITILVFLNFSRLKVLALFAALVLWLLSGRVVAFKAFPNGRVIIGWYYVETTCIKLCKENDDCEHVLFEETKIKRLPLWCISINNKVSNKVIFIGPFTWDDCTRIFEQQIGR